MNRPQPHPRTTSLIVTPDGSWTSLVREWHPGDARRCRLCPDGSCIADGPRCHMVIEGIVGPDEAPLYSSRGLARSVGLPPGR